MLVQMKMDAAAHASRETEGHYPSVSRPDGFRESIPDQAFLGTAS
jgi:hypothetical protein